MLDIGGGVGVIQQEFLKDGVSHAISFEASSAYFQADRQEAERQGHAGRITYYHCDFGHLAPQLPPAGVVTLDRVICCCPDMRALVVLSAARAAKLYGIVFPRDTWWIKAGSRLINFVLKLSGNSFRAFVHPTKEVEAVIRANGLAALEARGSHYARRHLFGCRRGDLGRFPRVTRGAPRSPRGGDYASHPPGYHPTSLHVRGTRREDAMASGGQARRLGNRDARVPSRPKVTTTANVRRR